MIILSDDIIFRKAVIHLLNVELGKFAPAQDLFMMQPDVIELVRKQVCYLLNSDELKAADWNTKEPVFQKLEQMNEKDDKSFIQMCSFRQTAFNVQDTYLLDGVKIRMPSNRNIRTDRRSIHSAMQDRPMNCMQSGRRVTDHSICTT